MNNAEHKMTENEIRNIWERLTASESSIRSAHKRIDNLEKLSDSVNNMAMSTAKVAAETNKIAEETRLLREDYNKADKEIRELKEKPVKRYETVVTALLTAICSGVAGYLLALIF